MIRIPKKEAFQKHLRRRYTLRLHMLVILLATTLSGVLFSKLLFMCDIADFRIRYPLSILASYLVFFFCIKLWLLCISPKSSKTNAAKWLDVPSPSGGSGGEVIPSLRSGGGAPPLRGAGGHFSGAGASASFESQEPAIIGTGILPQSQPVPTSAAGTSDGIGSVGDALGALGDDDTIVAVIVLAVLVGTIFFSAIYLLYCAPAILSEAAFQGFLAASLIKHTHTMSHGSWVGSVFKKTWIPSAVTIGVAFFSGIILHSKFPEAARLADILWKR